MSFKLKLLFLLIIPILGNCADRFITPTGNFAVLESNTSWSNFQSVGGQVYIFTNKNPNSTWTIYIHNYNDTTNHVPGLKIFGTSDSSIPDYTNNTTKWMAMIGCSNNASLGNPTVVKNSEISCNFNVDASYFIAIQFTSDGVKVGNTDNFDLIMDIPIVTGSNSTFSRGLVATGLSADVNDFPFIMAGVDSNPTIRQLQTDSSGNLKILLSNLTSNQNVNLAQINGVTSSADGSGNLNININASTVTGAGSVKVQGRATQGQAASNPFPIAGASSGNVDQILSDGSGHLQVVSPGTQVDPCQDPGQAKSSFPINISSATTVQLVANSGSNIIYVCGFSLTMVGAVESIKFVYGTKVTTDCDTGQTNLTGAYADGTASDIAFSYGPGSTIFKTIASQQLCAVTTGTVSIQGVLTYVQK